MSTELIGGRYEVGELLGRGGMAEVRKGTDSRLGRTVAIKRLRHDLASDATFQARFRREAQSSASLNHPSIVAVYDTGEEVGTDGVAQPYIVMEYVAGRTLRDILREGRKILPERALEITSDVLSALDYSHRAGIIHRDIKPGNVMLTPSGDVKVMDFGIARAISDAASTMTQTAAVVGTAQYLSPEQARGETVDSRSDVYSAGCLLYELLTGRPPFVGDSPVAVAYQHVREMPTPPSDHDTAIPPELDAIVLKSLAKRVEDRYQSAAAMRDDIERYLAGRPVSVAAPTAVVAALPLGAGATSVVPPLTPDPAPAPVPPYEEEPNGTPRGVTIALVLLILALIAAAIFGFMKLFPHDKNADQIQVPDVRWSSDHSMTETRARQTLVNAGLAVAQSVENVPNQTVPAGSVIDTDPAWTQAWYVAPGTAIVLKVSTGKPEVTMISLVNMNLTDAEKWLKDHGLQWTINPTKSDQPKNTVLDSNPRQGASVQPGSSVELTVSQGEQSIPKVVGLTEAQAKQALTQRGFKYTVFPSTAQSNQPYGTVTQQNYPANQPAPQGTNVAITVTHYAAPPTMQNDTASTAANTPVTIDVLANDSTSDPAVTFDKTTLALLGPDGTPVNGDLKVAGQGTWKVDNGQVTFTPDPTFVGATQPVTYQVSDTAGNVGKATVTVTVGP